VAENNIKVGLQLGVVGGGALKTAFGKTRREVETLKGSTDKLTRASKAAGTAQVSFATKGRAALASLKGSYDGLASSLGGLRMAAMALAAVPVTMGLNKALELQDVSIDLALGMGLDASAEQTLAALIQSASSSGIQSHADTGSAAQALVAGGVRDLEALGDYLPILTKAATATRAGMQELTGASLALRDNLGLGAEGFSRSMNMLSFASTQGQMGVAGMAKALPQLTQRMKGLPAEMNLSAEALMADLVAGLQVARLGANSDDEAARNLDAFMYRIFSPETGKRFESAGINLENSIKNLTSAGHTPMEAMLDTITEYVGSRGKGALDAFNNALAMEQGEARDAAFSALDSRYALGDLFVDEGVKNFMIAAMQNREMLQGLKADISEAAGQDVIGEDFIRRSQSGKVQLQKLRIELSTIGATLGGPLASALVSTLHSLMPLVQGFAQWAQDNPGMVKALLITAGGFAGLRLGIAGFFAVKRSGMVIFTTFKRAVLGMVKVLPILKGGLMLVGRALMVVGRALLMNPIGLLITAIAGAAYLIYKYWEPISAFFSGLWDNVKAIFSAAWEGITGLFSSVWETITTAFDGGIAGISALILDWSPLGLFYTAFAGVMDWFGVELPDSFSEFGSLLIDGLVSGLTAAWDGVTGFFSSAWDGIGGIFSSAWDGIKTRTSHDWQAASGLFSSAWNGVSGFFSSAWNTLADVFDGGIEGIAALIVDWSPLGLFYDAFAGVMDWFGVDLPDSFSEFGTALIDGLVGGITGAFGKAKEAIVGLGESVTGWFGSLLGINSPSRVFMQLGGFVSEGAALGIRERIPLAGEAVAQLAGTVMEGGTGMHAPPVHASAPALNVAAPTSTQIQFSPVINITATPGEDGNRLADRLVQRLEREFARLLDAHEHQQRRTAFSGAL